MAILLAVCVGIAAPLIVLALVIAWEDGSLPEDFKNWREDGEG